MDNKTLSAAANPDLANKLVQDAVAETTAAPEPAKIKAPLDVVVDLPGGYISPDGEVYRTAEVKELTGRDEEAIVKATSIPKAMTIALARGTVKIGDVKATEEVLDKILAADRDAIMLGIYRATFGDTTEIGAFCNGCKEVKIVEVDIVKDIEVKRLEDPLEDRRFKVQGRKSEFTVMLPEGKAQRELASSFEKTSSELDTLLLEYCVVEIDGRAVLGKAQIQNIGLADRRKLLEEIITNNPGPQFDDISTTCPDCGGEVVVPINLGTLFRF
jgi:hypothetical protein